MRILIVEDAEKLARALKAGLEAEGYAVDVLYDGGAARRRFAARRGAPDACGGEDQLPYDLLVLDVMLPGVDGFTLCRELRDQGLTVPVLMLTARDTTADKVTGLDSGADDYLVKPFAFEELLARIRTLLRRPRHALPPQLRLGALTLDPATREARLAGEPVPLSPKELSLLELFLRHPNEVLSRERILERAWDEEFDSFSNIVDVYAGRLRRKLDRPGAGVRLETVRGAGYALREGGR
ncbi:MAG TPA: response regulator transcription factor [Thermoleophilia bacterium]|nr:response regulator transcription factor [Thermoleophilia bacterium]